MKMNNIIEELERQFGVKIKRIVIYGWDEKGRSIRIKYP